MSTVSIIERLGIRRSFQDGNRSERNSELGRGARIGRIFRLARLPGIGAICGDVSLEVTGIFPYVRRAAVYAIAVPVPIDFVVPAFGGESELADLQVMSLARGSGPPVVPDFTNCTGCTSCASCASCGSCCSCGSSCSSCSSCDSCGSCASCASCGGC